MSGETIHDQHNPEALMASAMTLFGIDPGEKAKLKGIPTYSLRSRALGRTNRYRATFEHGPLGDELTTYRYPVDRALARTRFTSAVIKVHPLREDEVSFTDLQAGNPPEELEGIEAQDRIASFLAEAQTDIQATDL